MGTPKGNFVVPRNFDPEQKRFAQSLNESVAVLRGELGDPLDAAVTYNDLIDSGIAKRDLRIGSGGFIGGPGRVIIIPGDGTVLDIPPAPTGVEVSGAFQNILITWDAATFVGFSYAEIWTATSNTFADRVLVGTSTASVFSHQVGNGQTRYYWIRFVNIQGVIGPFNSTTGIGDSTVIDIGAQMALLSEELSDLPGYTALTSLISGTAAAAATVIRNNTEPTTRDNGDALLGNDIWIDTNDNNQAYFRNAANNTWIAARDSTLISLYNTLNSTVGTQGTSIATAQADIVTLTTDTSANATAITNLTASVNTNTAGISTEQTARANADTALAADITSLTSTVGTNTSAISSEATTRANADTALASDITSLTSTVSGNTSAISSEATTRASADAALTTSITNLTSTVGTNTSAISSEATTRANADTALASDITSLTSTVGTNTSAISSEATTRANADSALSTSITNLTSTVGTNTASVSTNASAITDINDNASAAYVLQLNANGKVAQMVLESNADAGTGATSTISFLADTFKIDNDAGTSVSPFVVSGGSVFIDNARITNLSGTKIDVDTLNVKHFADVSADIINQTGGTVPLRVTAENSQWNGTYPGSVENNTEAVYMNTTLNNVRNGAGYQVIYSAVLGNTRNGTIEYSFNNSTWTSLGSPMNTNAGVFRTYVFVWQGTLSGMSSSQETVYWRVKWNNSGSIFNSTYQAIYIDVDNTQ